MTVEGKPVACREVDCDFVYEALTDNIASFVKTGNTAGSTLTITGTDFPTTIKHVFYGLSPCDNVSVVSTTQITCTLVEDVVAGDWVPKVTAYTGLLNNAAATQSTDITFTSVTPSTGLNLNGGTLLTIAGSNFPFSSSVVPDDFSITFDDGSNTECVVSAITSSSIVCAPKEFNAAAEG